MSEVDADTGMPLRQTCDRCRYLKVRCEKDSRSPSTRCVRCARADARCIHNRRRRSGRPSTNNPLQTNTAFRDAQSNSGSSLSLDFCNDAPLQKWPTRTSTCPEGQALLEPSNDLFWPDVRSMASFQAMDQLMEYGEDIREATSFEPNATLEEHGLGFLADQAPPSESPRPENNSSSTRDATETDMRELTELSVRAYRVIIDAQAPCRDELFSMTQSVLKVLARIAATVRQQQQQPNEVSMPTSSNEDQQQDLQVVVDHGPRTSISLVLQAVSVCEQIYSAFVHACSALHSELEPHAQTSSSSGNEDDHRMADARAVMTVELINYLFEKLNRAQRQLLATALIADDATSSSSPDSLSPEGSITSLSIPSDLSSGFSTSVIPMMMHRAHGKHPQLQTHIQAIRTLTRNKDCL
ncbi:hypothetical protein EsH8_III_000230 [Colletotrichum jinshuiense]